MILKAVFIILGVILLFVSTRTILLLRRPGKVKSCESRLKYGSIGIAVVLILAIAVSCFDNNRGGSLFGNNINYIFIANMWIAMAFGLFALRRRRKYLKENNFLMASRLEKVEMYIELLKKYELADLQPPLRKKLLEKLQENMNAPDEDRMLAQILLTQRSGTVSLAIAFIGIFTVLSSLVALMVYQGTN